jgi:hypothetical protein
LNLQDEKDIGHLPSFSIFTIIMGEKGGFEDSEETSLTGFIAKKRRLSFCHIERILNSAYVKI